ncbi:MAG: cytochrome c3 family protein [Ignavibacteriae bacterium]|nr:cytochrome c3 family protein [Ignavibacteriota bacterium]
MKLKYVYTIVGLASILYFGFTNFTTSEEVKTRNQSIIIFSHSAHDGNAECADCHTNVAESSNLGKSLLPTKAECAACHDVEDEENCKMCHYDGVFETLGPKTSELLFNHKFHLENQSMKCEDCHVGIMEVNYSFESAGANPSMEKCFACHNDISVATNNCEQCHISTVNLIPENHQQVGFFKNHKFNNDNCEMCHSQETFCEDCHVATIGIEETNLNNDFYTPYSPHKYVDGTKQQVITRVHDLNFRFTHGIDAKGKTDNCQTCHQTETFCAECHTSEDGDFAMGGIMPLSHTSPNFVTGLTPGSEHAILAKRDIERCASCHDTQGADPNCIICHSDPDGVKGTNPKTHPSSFMSDTEGDWHSDGASLCYDCHSNTNIAGVGFCGYCHGADED